ncbi:MAG: LCP family protein [Candidatus Saccharimonadales bacterium]
MKRRRIYGTVDGVISRDPKGSANRRIGVVAPETVSDRLPRVVALSAELSSRQTARHPASGSLLRAEIEESLAEIDQSEQAVVRRPRRSWKRTLKYIMITVVIVLIGVGGFVGYKALVASGSIFKGGIFDIFHDQALKQDANGRSNIIIFGTSGYSDESDHPGANLTDSLILLSISQEKKDAFMLSLPRDLYVKHPDCPPLNTSAGKLNEVYYCASNDAKDDEKGAEALRAKVGEITGLDVQYSVHVNWSVLQQGVDAVGGVDVKIETDDPRGILDRNFDQTCNYRCYYVKYKKDEIAHLDGVHALALARARNANGGYGLSGGNFDREKNQQKILKALQEKAVSSGTLTNITKVTSLIDALGKNLRTNFQTKEIRSLLDIASKTKETSIAQLSLVEPGSTLVKTDTIDSAGSVVEPVAGLYDYSDIQAYLRKKLSGDAIGKEAATIDVLNGSDGYGFAARKKDELALQGIDVAAVGDAPAKSAYKPIQWYDLSGNTKPQTAKKLQEVLGVANSGSHLPDGVTSTSNFVIILGNGAY